MTNLVVMALVLLGAAPVLGCCTEVPIAADKLSMSRTGPHNGWLVFKSHDPNLVFLEPTDTPPYLLTVYSVTHCDGVTGQGFEIPQYQYHPPPRERYVLRSAGSEYYPRTKVVLARGKHGVRVRWHFEHATMSPFGQVGKALVRLYYGDYLFCARFNASTVLIDRPGRYVAKGALAPASCDTGCPPSE